jgi:hypothetical protein
LVLLLSKKSLKISEDVYRRWTDNAMTKRKRTKSQRRSTKHTHKTKDRVTW